MRLPSLSYKCAILGVLLLLMSCWSGIPSAAADSSPPAFKGREGAALRVWAQRKHENDRFLWDLDGDRNFEARGRIVSAAFPDNGTYVVRFKRVQRIRSSRSFKIVRKNIRGKKTVRVRNTAPTVDVGGPYYTSTVEDLSFHAAVSDPGHFDRQAGCSLFWDFGDGATLEQGPLSPPATHRYAGPGEYVVSVRARDKDGGLSRVARSRVFVSAGSPGTVTPTPTLEPVPPGYTVVQPEEIFGIIPNPGMGWQSTDIVNDDGFDAQGFANKVAYIKYYWKDLETAHGQYNWTRIDQHLARAHASGQKVAFRIVVMDNITSGPAWLRSMGAAGTWVRYTPDGSGAPQVWSPRLTDPIFQQAHFNFLRQLGLRYDGHPDLDSVDIGTVGLWGEWHFFAVSPAVSMPNVSTMRTIIDRYFDAFQSTPLVAQLENREGLAYAVSRGSGFRGDCLGNVPNQMNLLYEPNIAYARAENAWRQGPINFETCWTIAHWVNNGFNLRYIFDWALAHHISGIANKNSRVPSSAIPEVERLLKRMGYRYVLRNLRHPQRASRGQSLPLRTYWENIGVAPSYGNYVLGFQLRNSAGSVVRTLATSERVRNWMPGPFQVDTSLSIPSTLLAGTYTLAVGVVDPLSQIPAVQLSIAGRDPSGWYPLSVVEVQ